MAYAARINSLINEEIEDSLSSIDSNEDRDEDTFEMVVPDRKILNRSYGEIPSLETVRGVVILALHVTPTLYLVTRNLCLYLFKLYNYIHKGGFQLKDLRVQS